jgi:arabinogalactan endo-1,4-beta-galactosidase
MPLRFIRPNARPSLPMQVRGPAIVCAVLLLVFGAGCAVSQQPAEPTDISPINGEMYYLINQQTGLQVDLNGGSTTPGASILQQTRSFSSLTQRWALTRLTNGNWKISNISNGLCLDSAVSGSTTSTVQNTCGAATTQQWTLSSTGNGYYTIANVSTGLYMDLSGTAAGSALDQTALSTSATQSQQWLLRPVYFRGVDNALLEKQEANKVTNGVPWWTDADVKGDLLQMLKNHGVNMIRVRPTSVPPYNTYSPASSPTTCSGNGCYAETDAQDIDLAKRAKKLGMSVELTLLYDGGSSVATPNSYTSDSVSAAASAIYTYVKAEVEAYRSAGAMPDMVTIGNEVDTGFLTSISLDPHSHFGNFATAQIQAMQAVSDASTDTSIGPALPVPLRCIHVTPSYNLTTFFTTATNDGIPFDAMCQSYYPIYHGPLTAAQAAVTNPGSKPIEQSVLNAAATSINKPVYIIETGEHYESGFDSNDSWYAATVVGQRQFLIDLDTVTKAMPNNLSMGFEYWDATGINVYINGGGYSNGDGKVDALYTWNGLTLFDNADTQGYSNASLSNFSTVLPGMEALGGKLDPTLKYKLVNKATGQILETSLASTGTGAALDTTTDTGIISQHQQWIITSNGDGYFQVANGNNGSGTNVLDNGGSTTASAAVVQNTAAASTPGQEWNIITAGGGYYSLINKGSGLVLDAPSAAAVQQTTASSVTTDWVIGATASQLWQIIPAHITATSTAAQLAFASGTSATLALGGSPGTVNVLVTNTAGATIGSPQESITLTLTGPNSFSQTATVSSASGTAAFNLASTTLNQAGNYTLTGTATGLTTATATITVPLTNSLTSLQVSNAQPSTGQLVTFTANVASTTVGTPTGTVQFQLSGSTIGTGTLNAAGVATFTTSTLPQTSDSIMAVYLGDTNYNGSSSSSVGVTVSPQYIWLANGNGSLSGVSQSGTAVSNATSGGGIGVAVDSAGVIWSINASGSSVETISASGTVLNSGYAGGGLSGAAALAIDGLGQVWIANGNGSLTVLSNAGTAVSPSTGYVDSSISGPGGVAIDASGNVWISNSTTNTMDEVIGGAAPVAALSTAIQNNTLGAKP